MSNAAKPSAAESSVSPGPLILIVEDEADLIELHTAVLRSAGYEVAAAHDAVEALMKYVEANGAVRLIVADLHLPSTNAIEMYAQMQSLGPTPPILICTGMKDAEAIRELEAAGIHDHLSKPFSVADLLKKIAGMVG